VRIILSLLLLPLLLLLLLCRLLLKRGSCSWRLLLMACHS